MKVFVGDDVVVGIGEGVIEGVDGVMLGTIVAVTVGAGVAVPQAASGNATSNAIVNTNIRCDTVICRSNQTPILMTTGLYASFGYSSPLCCDNDNCHQSNRLFSYRKQKKERLPNFHSSPGVKCLYRCACIISHSCMEFNTENY